MNPAQPVQYDRSDPRKDFLKTDTPPFLLLLSGAVALLYAYVLLFLFSVGNPFLFALLVVGQAFNLWQVFTFIYTVWDTTSQAPHDDIVLQPVDVFITVAGEPVAVVEETVRAAQNMRYPQFEVYVLNDGFVAGKENWRDIEALASRLGVRCITRTIPGGAKAGNINNGLRLSASPLVAVFDADHVPHADFLRKTAPYFIDEKVAFVQTPQFYKNYAQNYLTQGSWEQQELFFGPICKGKNRLNAAPMCGTNMLIKREALLEVGGMCTESIAEDLVTGMFLHERGYKSVYHGEVLAEGLATEDLLSYSKQQFRWARGALDLIFRYNLLLRRGLTFAQRVQYLASTSFFMSGTIVLMHALLPAAFLFTGEMPVEIAGMLLAAVFLPYMFLTLYVIQRSSNFTFTFPSLGLSMGAWNIHIAALWAAALRVKSPFSITPKERQQGFFASLVVWHLAYVALIAVGIPVALAREGLSAAFVNNFAWAMINVAIFIPFIKAAFPSTSAIPQRPRRAVPAAPAMTYGNKRDRK